MTSKWHGDRVVEEILGGTLDGVELAAEHLLSAASPLAPHEEGDLERSGQVSRDDDRAASAVSFDRPYAVRQHEDLDLRHDPGRQAKFLEQPAATERPVMLRIIAAQARKPLQGA